jgi:hypothetical protein
MRREGTKSAYTGFLRARRDKSRRPPPAETPVHTQSRVPQAAPEDEEQTANSTPATNSQEEGVDA